MRKNFTVEIQLTSLGQDSALRLLCNTAKTIL